MALNHGAGGKDVFHPLKDFIVKVAFGRRIGSAVEVGTLFFGFGPVETLEGNNRSRVLAGAARATVAAGGENLERPPHGGDAILGRQGAEGPVAPDEIPRRAVGGGGEHDRHITLPAGPRVDKQAFHSGDELMSLADQISGDLLACAAIFWAEQPGLGRRGEARGQDHQPGEAGCQPLTAMSVFSARHASSRPPASGSPFGLSHQNRRHYSDFLAVVAKRALTQNVN